MGELAMWFFISFLIVVIAAVGSYRAGISTASLISRRAFEAFVNECIRLGYLDNNEVIEALGNISTDNKQKKGSAR